MLLVVVDVAMISQHLTYTVLEKLQVGGEAYQHTFLGWLEVANTAVPPRTHVHTHATGGVW